MLLRVIFVVISSFYASSAMSEDAEPLEIQSVQKLPEQEDMAVPAFKKTSKKETMQTFDCRADFSSTQGKMGSFSSHDDFYYHIVKIFNKKNKNVEKNRYILMKFDLHSFTQEKILSFETQKEVDAVVFYGEPLVGISLVFFKEEAKECLQGEAYVMHLSLNKELRYKAVRSEVGPVALLKGGYVEQVQKDNSLELSTFEQSYLYFLEKKSLLEIELTSHQTRYIPMISEFSELPLYFDMSKHRRYSWQNLSPKERTLKGYSTSRIVAGMVAFSSQDKVMQDGRFFAALKIFEDKNAIRIKELGLWSGKKEWKDFEVSVPERFDVKKAAMEANFKTQWSVLYGFEKETKMKWKNIHVFHYADLDTAPSPEIYKKNYIKNIHFSPNGLFLIVEEVSLDKEITKAIHLLDIAQKSWKIIFRNLEK